MIFLSEDEHQSFLQAGILFLLVIAWHAHRTQNSNFAIPLQYLKYEGGRYEDDFLHAVKHQAILQVNTINLVGHCHTCPYYIK